MTRTLYPPWQFQKGVDVKKERKKRKKRKEEVGVLIPLLGN